jgi:hypothetical protein
MKLPAISQAGVARALRRGVIVLGAAGLLVLPQLATSASFAGVEGVPGPMVVLVLGLAFWLMPVLLAASWAAEGRAWLPRPWLAVPVVLALAGAAVSTAFAGDKSSALVRAAEISGLWVGLWALVQAIRTDGERRFLLAVLVAAALVPAVIALHQGTVGLPNAWQYFQENREEVLSQRGIEPGSWMERRFIERFTGGVQAALGHPNVLAALLVPAILVGLGLVREKWVEVGTRGGRGLAIGLIAVLAAQVAALALTQSRAGLAAAAVGAYWLAVAWWVRDRRRRMILYAAPLVAGAIVLAIAGQVDHPAVAGALKTLRYRLDYWQATAGVLRERWLTGVGLENFGRHYTAHKLPTAPEDIRDAHNLFLSTWSALGLAGLAAVAALAALVIRGVFAARDTRRPAAARNAAPEPAAEAAGDPPRGESLAGLLGPAALVAGPVVILCALSMVGGPLGVTAAAAMVIVAGLGSAEAPSRLDASGRPLAALGGACVAALAAFALMEQIGTAILEPPTLWAVLVVAGVSLARGDRAAAVRSRVSSTGGPGTQHGNLPCWVPPGAALLPAAKFGIILIAMAVIFAYVKFLMIPVGRESVLMGEAALVVDPFERDAILRAAGEANPLAWEPALARGGLWQAEAADVGPAPQQAMVLGRAMAAYEEAVARSPTLRRAYLALAECRVMVPGALGDAEALRAALASMEEAARLYPTDLLTRLRVADLADRLGDKARAADEFRRLLELDGLMPEADRRLSAEQREAVAQRLKSLQEALAKPGPAE